MQKVYDYSQIYRKLNYKERKYDVKTMQKHGIKYCICIV